MTKRMNIPFSPPDMTEREVEAVGEVLRSGWITTGPKTKELEDVWQNSHIRKEVHALIRLQHAWKQP